jgi:hypothetical protein
MGELCYLEKNTEKCKDGNVVANHVFPNSSVGIFTSYEALRRYKLHIINSESYGDVATLA